MTARLDLLNSVLGNRVTADATRNRRAAGTTSIPAALSITLDRIDADPDQPRREFTQEDLDQLAASIRQLGVLQPIIVRYVADRDRYVVMDGERRLRASRQAKMSSIPCVVNEQDLTADRIMQLQLVANALRCDLSPLEAARAYQSLQIAWACSRKDLAAQLNISESKLSRTMAILDLPEQQQQAIAIGSRIEEYHLYWLEDVVAHDDYAGLARVADALATMQVLGKLEDMLIASSGLPK